MAEPKEPLTERELEVVRLLATGIGNKEIGAQLHVSPNTVRVHLRNIFTKLEAQSRTEVTMMAVRNGWVDAGITTSANGIQVPATESEDSSAPPRILSLPKDAPPLSLPVPVPVAPNPQTLPPLPVWQRAALVGTMALAVALLILVLQRPATEVAALPGEAAFENGTSPVAIAPSPAETTRWYARASVRTARARVAVAAVNGRVYIIGGGIDRQPSGEVLIYDPKLDDWQTGTPKPTPVLNMGAASMGSTIYVPGGTAADGLPSTKVEAFDVISGTWRSVAPLPRALAGHAVVATGNRVYVIGGRATSGIGGDMLVLDVSTNRWSALPPMPTPRTLLAASVVGNRIYRWVGSMGGAS